MATRKQAEKTPTKAAAKRATPKNPTSLRGKIRAMMTHRDTGRQHYRDAADLLTEILKTMKPGEELSVGNGQTARVVDRFEHTNRVSAVTYVSRFDVEITHE